MDYIGYFIVLVGLCFMIYFLYIIYTYNKLYNLIRKYHGIMYKISILFHEELKREYNYKLSRKKHGYDKFNFIIPLQMFGINIVNEKTFNELRNYIFYKSKEMFYKPLNFKRIEEDLKNILAKNIAYYYDNNYMDVNEILKYILSYKNKPKYMQKNLFEILETFQMMYKIY